MLNYEAAEEDLNSLMQSDPGNKTVKQLYEQLQVQKDIYDHSMKSMAKKMVNKKDKEIIEEK